VGCDADADTVTDMGPFPEGLQLSRGMTHVLVNGTFLIRNEMLDTEVFSWTCHARPHQRITRERDSVRETQRMRRLEIGSDF
jgi:hypothetical protein